MRVLENRANLSGKVGIVVGGGGGIGRAVTLALAGAGVDLAICDINENALSVTQSEIAAMGRRTLALPVDALDASALEHFYAAARQKFERLDILVNVVGGVTRRSFVDSTDAQCAADIERNYGYVLRSVRHALPWLIEGGRGGSIINFTTVEAHRGAAGFAVYAGAKAATANFTRALAVELGPQRIRVNAIATDTTPSDGNMEALGPDATAELIRLPAEMSAAAMAMYVPMKEPPPVEDVANGVLFLASDLSKSVTGTTLHVDGGTWAAGGFVDWPFGDGQSPAPLAGTLKKLFGEGEGK